MPISPYRHRLVIGAREPGAGSTFESIGVEGDGAEGGTAGEDFGVFRRRANQRIGEVTRPFGGALIAFGLHFEMKAELIVEFAMETPLGKQAAEFR